MNVGVGNRTVDYPATITEACEWCEAEVVVEAHCCPPMPLDERCLAYLTPHLTSKPMSVRIFHALRKADVYTVGDLKKLKEADLRRIPTLGRQSIRSIQNWIWAGYQSAPKKRKSEPMTEIENVG